MLRRRNPLLFIAALSLAGFMAGPVSGADKTQQAGEKKISELSLEDMLSIKIGVSSTKGETILESSSAVTIIDRRMLDEFSFRNVIEALQVVAGISVGRSYMLQGMVTSRGLLQDLYANKNLLLIDGVPTWNAVTGENRPERLHVNDIERIEILKGPASVLYGSQAYTGAINIVTRSANPGTQSLNSYATGGLGGAWGVGGNYRANTKKGFRFSLGVNQNHGQRIDYSFLDENGTRGNVRDYSDATTVTMKLSYAGHSLLVNTYDLELGTFGSNPSFKGGAGSNHHADGVLSTYEFNHTFKGKLNLVSKAFYDYSGREFQRDSTNTVYSPIRAYRTGGTARLNYGIAESLNLEVGTDLEYRHASEASSRSHVTGALVDGFVDQSATEWSTFAQLDWKPGPWRLVGGSRYTKNSIFGNNVSSRATVGYKLNDRNAVKFVAGQSYRAPSLFELFTATPNITGNPKVQPETSGSLDLVYQYTKGGFYLQGVGYYAEYDNKIFRLKGKPPAGAPNPNAPAYYANGTSFHAIGFELEAKYISEKWGSYFINLDRLGGNSGDLVVEQPGNYRNYNFRYTPTHSISAGAFKRYRFVGGSAVLTYTPSTSGPFGPVDSWTDVSLNLFFEHKMKDVTLRHTFSGRNVFDSYIAFPEFSRRRAYVNDIPFMADPGFFYTMEVRF